MSDTLPKGGGEELPKAQARPRGWSLSFVWVVPILAVIVAGFLVYERVREMGPAITIRFDDAGGLQAGQTQIKYRGVPIGEVSALELTPDHQQVIVRARLRRSAASIARAGTQFWIIRPEVKGNGISGLTTMVTGPEIQAQPGGKSEPGKEQTEFVGLDSQPSSKEGRGLRIILRSNHLGSLKEGTSILYRGVPVGEVQEPELSNTATAVDLYVLIKPRYARLVRSDSRFWNVSGASMHASLFHGIDVKLDSLTSLVAGGIAFATPPGAAGKAVGDGSVFALNDNPQNEWLQWAPEIKLPPPTQR